MSRLYTKFQRMVEARRLYLTHPEGLSDQQLARHFGCDRASIFRLRSEMDNMVKVKHGYFTASPTPDEIELAKAILNQ